MQLLPLPPPAVLLNLGIVIFVQGGRCGICFFYYILFSRGCDRGTSCRCRRQRCPQQRQNKLRNKLYFIFLPRRCSLRLPLPDVTGVAKAMLVLLNFVFICFPMDRRPLLPTPAAARCARSSGGRCCYILYFFHGRRGAVLLKFGIVSYFFGGRCGRFVYIFPRGALRRMLSFFSGPSADSRNYDMGASCRCCRQRCRR